MSPDTNDSEYIRDLIQREQERSAEVEALRSALIEGEASGEAKPFDAGAFKRKMRLAWLNTGNAGGGETNCMGQTVVCPRGFMPTLEA